MRALLLLTLPVALLSCDRSGLDLVPVPTEGVPSVLEMGQLDVVDLDTFDDPELRRYATSYADVGAPEEMGGQSGATFTFQGTGDWVCIIVDPEAVFWNQSVATTNPNDTYVWGDNYLDDGDMDMAIGLSANYTGSPGLYLGDFVGQYTDSNGQTVEIEYDLCQGTGYWGQSPAHAGRAAPEFCAIDTKGREGIEYTVVLKTFSLPIDDNVLSFATIVKESGCRGITECTLPGESPQEGYEDLEAAYCDGEVSSFCEVHPEMCGDEP